MDPRRLSLLLLCTVLSFLAIMPFTVVVYVHRYHVCASCFRGGSRNSSSVGHLQHDLQLHSGLACGLLLFLDVRVVSCSTVLACVSIIISNFKLLPT